MHGHDLIEQGLAGLDQERRSQGVALRRGEALQGLGVVSPAELGKVLQQLRRRRGKIHPGPQQSIQQIEFGEAGRDCGGTCCWRGFFEARERGAVLAVRHVHHVLDRVTQVLRQPGCDAVEQVLHRMGRHRGDQAFQGAGRRQHDPRRAQVVLGQGQQRPGQHAFRCAFLQPAAKPLLSRVVELAPSEVLANTLELGGLGRRPFRVGQE